MRRRRSRESVPDFFDEVPLGVKSLKFIKHLIGAINGGQLDLVSVAHALVKVGDPLLSRQFNKIVKSGAPFVVSHGRVDSGP